MSPITEQLLNSAPLAVQRARWQTRRRRRRDIRRDIRRDTMKAIRLRARGGSGQLAYEDAPRPQPQAGEALARVHAAAITPTEFTWLGANQEFPLILGHEFSGVVVELGPNTTGVRVGAAIYGLPAFARDGAQAEYVIVTPRELAPKPQYLDHAQAAEVPISALTAWQALFE